MDPFYRSILAADPLYVPHAQAAFPTTPAAKTRLDALHPEVTPKRQLKPKRRARKKAVAEPEPLPAKRRAAVACRDKIVGLRAAKKAAAERTAELSPTPPPPAPPRAAESKPAMSAEGEWFDPFNPEMRRGPMDLSRCKSGSWAQPSDTVAEKDKEALVAARYPRSLALKLKKEAKRGEWSAEESLFLNIGLAVCVCAAAPGLVVSQLTLSSPQLRPADVGGHCQAHRVPRPAAGAGQGQ